ncbi:MAG: SDR family oxidoreductase [Natrialbaceae archaeon]|nr:SDR family oxidoreductase [Natrialbaceae archaeon]
MTPTRRFSSWWPTSARRQRQSEWSKSRSRRFGGLDVTFANAGVAEFGGSPARYNMDSWDRILSVNLRGVFMTDRAAAGAMQTDGGGSIINTASILGLTGTQIPGLAAYTASKGGVIQVTRQLAAQLGQHDIRVNAMAPGWINTDMTAQSLGMGNAGEALRQQLVENIPLGRTGEPDDLKGMALYLASDASRYTSGEIHLVDGGMHALQSVTEPVSRGPKRQCFPEGVRNSGHG